MDIDRLLRECDEATGERGASAQEAARFAALTDEQRTNVIRSINTYSPGGHPFASADNLQFFTVAFALQMLRKAKRKGHPVAATIAALSGKGRA